MTDMTATEAAPGVLLHDPTPAHIPLVSDGYRRYAMIILLLVYTAVSYTHLTLPTKRIV